MLNTVSFSRGVVIPNREDALRRGLNLENASSRHADDVSVPPGHFFNLLMPSESLLSAETWARDRGTKEQKDSMVIDLTLTPETYPLLHGRIHRLYDDPGGIWTGFIYLPVNEFSDFEIPTKEVVINTTDLTHEDLTALDVRIGFSEPDGEFTYRSYAEWSEALGIRANTRDEIGFNREGTYRYPYMRR